MPILNQPVQQFSPWHGSLVRKSSVQSRERDSVLLGHCRQGPNHDPSFWDVDSGCVPARILQQPFQLISQAAWSPIQAGPRIVLQDSEQFRLHARGVASQPFAQGEPQPTVGVKRVCRKPLQKIATGKPEITPVQRIPALLRRRWQRRWQWRWSGEVMFGESYCVIDLRICISRLIISHSSEDDEVFST